MRFHSKYIGLLFTCAMTNDRRVFKRGQARC